MELQRIVGANIRNHRRAKRWTLERLASETGYSREIIGKIERGVSAPLFETVENIAKALKVPASSLFGAHAFPAGDRGRTLQQIHSTLSNLNDKQLIRALRMLDAFSE